MTDKITTTEKIAETVSGQILPNYRDRSFEITETDYQAQVLATMPTFGTGPI